MNHFPVLLQRNLHAQCASQACACVLCAKLLQCCCPRTWPARVSGAMQRQAITFLTHHIAPFTLHIWALFIWFHVFPYVSYVLLGYFHVIWAQLKLSHALELLSTYLGASARQRNGVENCSFKTGSRRQSRKKTILKHFLKGFLKGKLLAPKLRKSAAKSLSQPGCSHSNTIYAVQL